MSEHAVKVLQDAGISLAGTVFVVGLIFLGIAIPLGAAIFVFTKRLKQQGANVSFKWQLTGRPLTASADGNYLDPARRSEKPTSEPFADGSAQRHVIKSTYKVLTFLIAVFLFAGAFFAWQAATPANQLLLVAGILFILGLIVLLSTGKLDRQDRAADNWHSIWRDVSRLASVNVTIAEPEVHRIGPDAIVRATHMREEGRPLDEICAMIDPGYAGWHESRQMAFRKLVEAMLMQQPR